MQYQLGVMQGRLLPKYKGRFQAHPVDYWQDEFKLAKKLGLKLIEFILDYNEYEKNPLMTENGLLKILQLSKKSGVKVKTVCADYFIESPLNGDPKDNHNGIKILNTLIRHAKLTGITDIVLPCLEKSSLNTRSKIDFFVRSIKSVIKNAETNQVNIALETDLNPANVVALLESIDSKRITITYDMGNSASLGFNPIEEFAAYGDRISNVHIKDRVVNGSSVVLGTGDTDFDMVFKGLNDVKYSGPYILQTFRDDEGNALFKKQLDWLKSNIGYTF